MSSLVFALVLAAAAPKPDVTPLESKDDQCFIDSLCSLKESVRWKTPAWTNEMCIRVGRALIAEETPAIPRNLLLSIMINESSMDEKAARFSYKNGKPVAWDGGLMGMRCRFGKDGRSCKNLGGRLTYTQLLKPETNIKLAAHKLATILKKEPCRHKDHPWFAHYNWGSKVFHSGIARSYPQRIAVLWKALVDSQGVYQPELAKLTFVQEPGKKRVTIDTPVGSRHKELVSKIWSSRSLSCTGPVSEERPDALALQ